VLTDPYYSAAWAFSPEAGRFFCWRPAANTSLPAQSGPRFSIKKLWRELGEFHHAEVSLLWRGSARQIRMGESWRLPF